MEFAFAPFELVDHSFAVFKFVEVGGDGVGCAFACEIWEVSLGFVEAEGEVKCWGVRKRGERRDGRDESYLKRSILCKLARTLSHLEMRCTLLLHWQRIPQRSCAQCPWHLR